MDVHSTASEVESARARVRRRPSNHPPREAWMWKNVLDNKVIHTIDQSTLNPSNTPVSSVSGSELVCSYNWRIGDPPRVYVPGFAAALQHITLPKTLSEDMGPYFVDQNAARVVESPFEPLFQATVRMNPSFRFNDVDILVNRNSLRKLLEFSAGRRQDSFRLNLYLVHHTLVIERSERSARQLIRGYQNSGWGRNFEQTFTKYPLGLEDSAAHHRALRYRLGELSCVVRFEVDACYEETSTDGSGSEWLTAMMDRLAMNAPIDAPKQTRPPMPQTMAAELKTASKLKNIGAYIPQLWFGRTPWLILGRHTNGTFTEVKITHAEPRFHDWEARHQTSLRTLVAVLARLRQAVEDNGREHCVAIYEKSMQPPIIEIFDTLGAKKTVPDDLRPRLWNIEDGVTSG